MGEVALVGQFSWLEHCSNIPHNRGVQLIFIGGHSLMVAFKGPNVILGLYKCNHSLTRDKELGTAAR